MAKKMTRTEELLTEKEVREFYDLDDPDLDSKLLSEPTPDRIDGCSGAVIREPDGIHWRAWKNPE